MMLPQKLRSLELFDPRFLKIIYVLVVAAMSFKKTSGQTITVDVSQVIKTLTPEAVGINMNYLMDGTYLNAGTQAATGTALKNMNMKFLRYPGGEKSDNFLWSVPPFNGPNHQMALTGDCDDHFPSGDLRFVNSDYTTTKSVVLEFDEFMTMAREVGAEPLIVCAYDAAYFSSALGTPAPNPCGRKPTVQELITIASEWVRYANITKGYNIKYWMIGNESWNNCIYNGCVTPVQYAQDISNFVAAMKAVDPTIKIIANGKGSAWWQTLLEGGAASQVDYFGVSCYPIDNYTGGYETYRTSNPTLLDEVEVAANALTQFGLPADKDRIKIITTEYNAIDFSNGWANNNDVGHALISFEMLGQNLSHPKVDAALFWNTRWVNETALQHTYDALDQASALNANGTALSIWGNNVLPQLVSSVTTDAGSNFIKAFSMYDNASKKLNILVVNKDNTARSININVAGLSAGSSLSRYEFKGSNDADKSPTYTLLNATPEQINVFPHSVSVARNSITVLQFRQIDFAALPLDIISFNAALKPGKKVILTWATGAADCGNRYTVQRREDGGQWTDLSTFNDHCSSLKEYQFTDDLGSSSFNRFFYRIRQTDAQGDRFFSNVTGVNLTSTTNSFTVKVLKQPAVNHLELSISNGGNGRGVVTVYDLTGAKKKQFPSVGLNGTVKLDISDLPKGMYIVEVSNGSSRQTVKALKH